MELIFPLELNTSNEVSVPRHDILEVHMYFDIGLISSRIDSWFTGPTPQFTPADLGIPTHDNGALESVLKRVHETLDEPSSMNAFIVRVSFHFIIEPRWFRVTNQRTWHVLGV